MQLFFGFLAGVFIAFAAWRLGALALDGAAAAAVMGGMIFGLGGWRWAALLLAFFISSSLLSKAFARRKTALDEKFSKGSRRDAGQVLANGGLGILFVLAYTLWPQPWLWLAFAGAMASVNADTWATEIGVLSKAAPRLITTGRPVERGTSGGVSWLGLGAAVGGALFIGGLASLLDGTPYSWLAAGLGGLLGSLFDSFLGATLQAIYFCPACQKETERSPLHPCGATTVPLRGLSWLDNDWVNGLASLFGALVSVGLWRLLA